MRIRALCLIVVCVAASALSASAREANEKRIYMIALRDAPLIEHVRSRLPAQDKIAMRRELSSTDSAQYVAQLDDARNRLLSAATAMAGRSLSARHVYRNAVNGFSIALTEAEAAQIKMLPDVAAVRRGRVEHVLTDAGPQWIGADELWNGAVSGSPATKGEGVVIGIIDTGINPTHPSFAAKGADGYTITNPRGHFYGLCANGQATCNTKLIGIYDMTDEGTKGVDSVGHGSHVSGIAAGNQVADALQGFTVALSRNVSGVAPHANIIMYKACTLDTTTGEGTCAESDLVAAIDQATADGVDVINYSIGGDPQDPYALLKDSSNDAYAFFQARAAGTVIAVAAGNEGPGPNSIDEPGNVPWVIAVANASHNRRFSNSIENFTGAAGAPPTLVGQGYTAGYGPAPIVYAGDFGNALCGTGPTQGTSPTGTSNPFPPGTFHGQIVICDRGVYARVEKGYNVKQGGAGGFVLANAETDGESIISDNHYLPAVHLGYNEGQELESWATAHAGASGTISGVSADLQNSYGDILEASSSRGPYGFSGGILKPDVTAPGSNILSTAETGTGLALMTGTSMASPHVAGSAALMIAEHPTWTPSQVESALLGTALAGSVRKEDAVTPATPLDAGAGRVQPAAAARAGLYLALSADDFRAQDPSAGGDPSKLNRSGVESENCLGKCSFVRTVTDMSGGGTWQVSSTISQYAKISVTPAQFTLASGASQVLTISVDVSDPNLPGNWSYGSIVLHKSTGGQSASDTALTAAVYSSPGTAPAFQEIALSGPAGSTTFSLGGLTALPQATFKTTALVAANVTEAQLSIDPNPDQLYETFPAPGKTFELFQIPSGADVDFTYTYSGRIFIVEITSSDAPLTNLYAGIDSNGDGLPNAEELKCSASVFIGSTTTARCVIDLRNVTAKDVWAMVEVPSGGTGALYNISFSSGFPTESSLGVPLDSRMTAVGPGHTQANDTFALRLSLSPDAQPLIPGTRYYGAVLIDGLPVAPSGQSGIVPLAMTRASGQDDATDALDLAAERFLVLQGSESLQHQFVDVAGEGTLVVGTALSGDANGNLVFYVQRADFPESSSSPTVAAAPGASASATVWSINATTPTMQVPIAVTPGRWYIVAKNLSSMMTQFSNYLVYTPDETFAAVASSAPGSYYNPQRSGHGVFISQAGSQQALYWYTYLEDGTPGWYVAQNQAPAGGAWTSPLYRVTWTGTAVDSLTPVGDVIVTPVSGTDFMFSWHLNGTAGSERFTLLAPNECVGFGGGQSDFTGQWYAPAQSGYGMDVVGVPTTASQAGLQFAAFYFYDSLGQPRWVVGSTSPFAASSTIAMGQYTGFCPTCAYAPVTSTSIGTLKNDFSSATAGTYVTNLTLIPPLNGNWNISQTIARLSGSPTCP